MTDHTTRVREQAEREAWDLFPDEGYDLVSGEKIDDYGYAQTERKGYVRGQVDLASRLTREKIAIALAKKTTPRWDELPGDMHIMLIHSKYGEAVAILSLMVEGEA